MRFAFTYYEKKGFIKESDYPYTHKDGLCKYDKKIDLVVGFGKGFEQNGDTEEDLQASLIERPTAAAINTWPIMKYESGIYDDITACPANPRELNHAVLVVGYGADSTGAKYWIVKNSYGVKWGESGYIRLGKGLVSGGTCGVALDTSYVLV